MTPPWIARLLRQPIVHFTAIGLAAFVIQFALADESSPITDVSSETARSHVSRELEAELGRPPSAEELQAALTQWRRDEVAYRAALDRGLGDSDPLVRTRLQQQFRDLQGELFVPPEPTEPQLRQWLAAHPERYATLPSFDFRHVFASAQQPEAEARAEKWLAELSAGADATDLGDEFAAGAEFVAVPTRRVEVWFGQAFGARLTTAPLREWSLIESKLGWHVVRVERRQGGGELPFEQLRSRLAQDVQADARRRYVDATLDTLADEYLDSVDQ